MRCFESKMMENKSKIRTVNIDEKIRHVQNSQVPTYEYFPKDRLPYFVIKRRHSFERMVFVNIVQRTIILVKLHVPRYHV